MKQEVINIEVGTSIQLQFQRTQMKLENIFKEFIDNSLQSYLTKENNDELKKNGTNKCIITIKISEDEIEIKDNAYGMDLEAFKRALTLNEKNKNYPDGSLGEFGMGLKYAAISLGNKYTIESKMLGDHKKYSATIDSELLKQNIKTVSAIVDELQPKNQHYTKITITNLIVKITQKDRDYLRDKLSKIYHIYLGNDDLEITILPNQKVIYNPPQLWINEDGSEYQEDFSGDFSFDDNSYDYFGWIGILDKADTSKEGKAGFSLLKQDRVILSNYRPESLLGKSNLYPFQRIVGEINLDQWPVDFNKGSFSWNNGLEDKFIMELKKNNTVNRFIRIATELRKKEKKNRLSNEKQQKMVKKDHKLFQNLGKVTKTVILDDRKDEDIPVNTIKEEDSHQLEISYQGKNYVFFVNYRDEDDADSDWIDVKVLSHEKNQYIILINNNLNLFKKLKQGESQLMQTFAIIIALSQLSSIRSGFKDSYKFVKAINEIIKYLE